MLVRLTLGDLGVPGWGESWFPLRVLLLLSHVQMYGDVFALFGVLFGFSRHTQHSTMMHKTSLFQLSWPCSQCRFCVSCVFLFGVLFLVWNFCSQLWGLGFWFGDINLDPLSPILYPYEIIAMYKYIYIYVYRYTYMII